MRLKNIKKEKKGISLVVLLIVIGVMLILLSTITISLDNIVTNSKKRQFAKEIYEIQSMVDTYKKQNDDYPYIKLAEGNKTIDLEVANGNENQVASEDVIDDKVTLYVINMQKIGANELSRGYNQNGDETDVYAFSNKTGIVYYVKGYSVRRNTYYTLTDELRKLIGLNTSNSSSSGIIKREDGLNNNGYINYGLILYLDGIDNTKSGHSATTTVWEDLSGNGNDYNLNNVEILNKSMKFLGNSSSYGVLNTNLSQIFGENVNDVRTIELVVKPYTNSGVILSGGFASKKAIGFFNSRIISTITRTNLFGVEDLLKTSNYSVIYANDIIAKQNAKNLNINNSSNYWEITENISYIGKRGNGITSYSGEVMAIRVYNRSLTELEIKHNYNIDKERFNLE